MHSRGPPLARRPSCANGFLKCIRHTYLEPVCLGGLAQPPWGTKGCPCAHTSGRLLVCTGRQANSPPWDGCVDVPTRGTLVPIPSSSPIPAALVD